MSEKDKKKVVKARANKKKLRPEAIRFNKLLMRDMTAGLSWMI